MRWSCVKGLGNSHCGCCGWACRRVIVSHLWKDCFTREATDPLTFAGVAIVSHRFLSRSLDCYIPASSALARRSADRAAGAIAPRGGTYRMLAAGTPPCLQYQGAYRFFGQKNWGQHSKGNKCDFPVPLRKLSTYLAALFSRCFQSGSSPPVTRSRHAGKSRRLIGPRTGCA